MTILPESSTAARSARRLLAVALLATLLTLLLPSGRAHACSCVMVEPQSRLQETEAAFVGVLRERSGPVEHTRFTFDVDAVMAGQLAPTVTIVAPEGNGANCGLNLEPGDRIGLFLHGTPSGWSSSSCDAVDPGQLLSAGAPRPPDPSLAVAGGGPASSTELGPWLVVGATATAAAAVLGGVVWLSRRRTT